MICYKAFTKTFLVLHYNFQSFKESLVPAGKRCTFQYFIMQPWKWSHSLKINKNDIKIYKMTAHTYFMKIWDNGNKQEWHNILICYLHSSTLNNACLWKAQWSTWESELSTGSSKLTQNVVQRYHIQ